VKIIVYKAQLKSYIDYIEKSKGKYNAQQLNLIAALPCAQGAGAGQACVCEIN